MHYAALASGSKGNCHALSDGERTLLIDAGISLRQIRQRLEALAFDPAGVQALALTHEHSDHIGALGVILRRTDWAILATADTRKAAEKAQGEPIPNHRWVELKAGQALDWQGWRVLPFALPHDAADPVAYRVEADGCACAVVTDLGHPTALVADHLQELDLLVLEANHDVDMLREGDYPPQLKARILSRVGHLSNASMAELLARVCSPRLKRLVLAHLSESNNHPDLARFAAEEVLRGTTVALHVAHQREPLALSTASH
ncbi:MBL fold metallo-hydrolase [Geothrix limicola]|uniref:MBL fold metallo-hydrolase n=1 Tax=Geothrix limicola TaxID=2927978 RepID=A0ABQ5QEZ5_9BACT|nr:MBL fold metallo-hydrolase [Geothrix limicola]GLH73217.1 MBL fold metallo-hydrolase [Geothrix limicola]